MPDDLTERNVDVDIFKIVDLCPTNEHFVDHGITPSAVKKVLKIYNSILLVTTPQYCAYFMKVLYGAMIRPTKEKYNLSSTKHFGDIYHEQDC